MGRPRKNLTADQVLEVERLAGLGLTEAQVGDALGMSERTLRSRITDTPAVFAAFKRGKAALVGDVGRFLRAMATGAQVLDRLEVNDEGKAVVVTAGFGVSNVKELGARVTAAIWLTKTQGRWSEPPRAVEHSGPGGGPIRREATPADLAKVARRVTKLLERARERRAAAQAEGQGVAV
jgi:hypothetical protein